ncbi:hypothetical protein [Jiella sonneratiae]|uniref:Uncharacterized protein n=1 Tax=Jiella sonneratiae TaxID=2816856 RepID=A0ABS3J5H9_9HYPH|nr:hypothetical protein [Jiella sonneratiae]MBO0903806.1 hypothetical protein [Jiella sonneratiae]
MTNRCTCTGPVCSCGAEGVVKDGASVRVNGLTMDSARCPDSGQADYERRIADGWKASDAAYQAMLDRDRNAWQGDTATTDKPVADRIKEKTDDAYAQAFADAKAAGQEDAVARSHASYEAWKVRMSNAWRVPA